MTYDPDEYDEDGRRWATHPCSPGFWIIRNRRLGVGGDTIMRLELDPRSGMLYADTSATAAHILEIPAGATRGAVIPSSTTPWIVYSKIEVPDMLEDLP